MSTPTTPAGQATSYKTNVNRAKTKRWVEAKSYSYDGDDWGDVDDYDEYGGYDEPEPSPKPTGLRQRGQSASQGSQSAYGHNAPQGIASHGTPSNSQYASAPPLQQSSARNMTTPAMEHQIRSQNVDSFDQEGGRRTFSAGPHPPTQSSQNISAQDFQPGMNQGYPNQPSQPPPTHHVSSFSIQPGFDSQARHGPQPSTTSDNYRSHQLGDQMHVLSHDSRIQSASNYSSAPGLMDRRDFSPSAMPPPLQTRNSPSPHSNPQGRPPRKSSLSQQSQPALPFDPRAPPSAPFSNALDGQARSRAGSSASGGKSSVLIRPADIYKRMEEERERERQSQESSRPSMDAITGKPAERSSLDTKLESDSAQRLKPKLDAVTERKSEYGFEGLKSDMQPKGNDRKTPEDLAKHNDKKRTTSKTFNLPKSSQPSAAQESTLSPGLTLPDPTRISGWGQGFGESFLGPRDTHGQLSKDMTLSPVLSDPSEKPTGRDQHISEPDLRHQQSKGFRSAVHQAFDTAQEQVPPTPSSNADSSIGRSTSGGTSTVSPIMSRGPSAVDRDRTHELPSIEDVTTPTQEEDNLRLKTRQRASGSVGTLTQASQNLESQNEDDIEPPPPGFIMGHRRESGTPSPDNSPARLPILASMSHLRHPHEADLAQATPTPTDSVPSASNSLRVSETSEVSEASAAKGFRSADVQSTSSSDQVASDPTTEMAVPHNLPYSLNRTNSSGSGRVKNLVENFESSTRPDSPQSITTPRASLLGQNPVAPNVRGNGRPANERMESFRPQLPGGWESSASIMPSQGYSYQDSVLSHDANKEAPAELPATRKMSLSRNDEQSELAQTGDMSSRVHRAAAGAEKTSAAAMLPPPLRSELSGADQSASKSSKAPTSLPKDTARQEPFTSDSVEPTSQRDASSASTMSPSPAKQPPSLPSLSTDVGTEQYESDRLRREIVRELRSEPSTAESASSYQASSRYPTNESVARYPTNDSMMSNDHGSGHVPSEYDKYWNDDEEDTTSVASRDPSLAHRAAVAQKEGTSPLAETSPKPDEQHHGAPQEFLVAPQTGEDSRPLKRRFSWEAELADLSPSQAKQKVMPQEATLRDTAPASNSSKPQITTERNPMQSQSVAPPSPDGFVANQMQHTIRDDESLPDSPELEIPTAGASQSLADDMPPPLKDRTSSLEGPEAIVSQPVDHTIWTESAVHDSSELRNRNSSDRVLGEIRPSAPHISTTERMQALPTPPPPSSEVPKLPAFREIMALKTPQERILAFDETQRKFANLNTGLAHWIATTSNALPEHSDLVQTGGQMGVAAPDHKASPSRSKTGQPYYQQYLDASPQSQAGVNAPAGSAPGPNQSQGFSPSGNKITSQQVQAKSKEFLHTAGVFGGKANIAAKGLFSKGKNKLRDASGSKKV
ncbi:uncharacterized protein KY384_001030 [Bacidia gigantensis]|uniref:uncharacterized protein n=1 Tax=Bacidia gigantensis TaxID=2732470 RepID=UPI001D043298|nr:uncharacterized protein KY384_001030 [Bacidia gigantensis]KAG8534186.1 hypothetical protein KY384_001030 [Bacidia gigantensis]